jgi:hypothetical protein
MRQPVRVALVLAVCLVARPPDRLTAQLPDIDTAAVVALPPSVILRDTSGLIKPKGALWRSLLIPGWGQARAGRHVAGAAFVMWEGVTIMMTLRAAHEKQYLIASGSANVASKDQQVQDWVVLWGFNHLFAGAEAFVAAHLQDFPKELKLEAVPGGVGVRLPL